MDGFRYKLYFFPLYQSSKSKKELISLSQHTNYIIVSDSTDSKISKIGWVRNSL